MDAEAARPSPQPAWREEGRRGGIMADEILIDDDAGVRTITLNRPDRLKALTSAIMAPLADACADAARDPAVGCVVVTGAGRGFRSEEHTSELQSLMRIPYA